MNVLYDESCLTFFKNRLYRLLVKTEYSGLKKEAFRWFKVTRSIYLNQANNTKILIKTEYSVLSVKLVVFSKKLHFE